jgi:hypothetical protein
MWIFLCSTEEIFRCLLTGFAYSSIRGNNIEWMHHVHFFFFVVLGLELRAYTLSHSTSHCWKGFFKIESSWIVCPGWPWTVIVLISASWVARITGLRHSYLATFNILKFYFLTVLNFELRALCLLGRNTTAFAHPPTLLCLSYFFW